MEYNVAKIRDKIRIYEKSGKESSTFFLTPAEVQEAISILRNYEYTLSGGYDEAERRIFVIGNSNADLDNYLAVVRIESFNAQLTHRNVLGSIVGLGIKREMIGDIIVNDKLCDVIIICEMLEYILNNLRKVGNEKISITEVKLCDLLPVNYNKELLTLSIASLRADAVISATFGISREKSSSLVTQEKVLINFLPCLNNSKGIKAGDLISVRGYGRIRIIDVVRRN